LTVADGLRIESFEMWIVDEVTIEQVLMK